VPLLGIIGSFGNVASRAPAQYVHERRDK